MPHAKHFRFMTIAPKLTLFSLVFAVSIFAAEKSAAPQPVSYTHLTLPTNREV